MRLLSGRDVTKNSWVGAFGDCDSEVSSLLTSEFGLVISQV